jgi:hypothetical protein
MNPSTFLKSSKGSTAVEVIAAVVILAMLAIMGSRFLLASTRAVSNHRLMSKATTLGDMVIQQYDVYAAQGYSGLDLLNKTTVAPSTFFGKTDNFGFDGLDITTKADFGQNKSSCTVTATIGWREGGTRKTAQFVKVYTATYSGVSGAGGGLVQVSVIPGCGGYTTLSDIQANCPGAQNMNVSAPSTMGVPVTAVTGPNGSAILTGVMIGSSVTITVTAPTNPSGVDVDPTNPNFVQGYVASWDPTTNNYTMSVSTTIVVTASVVNRAIVVQFLAAGVVTGVLANNSDAGVVSGMLIRLGSNAMVAAGGNGNGNNPFQTCNNLDSDACNVLTSTGPIPGQFALYNVLPGPETVYADGSSGSSPIVAQTDPAFVWGYTNPTGMQSVVWSTAAIPIMSLAGLSVARMGWLVVQTGLTAGTTVWAQLPSTPLRNNNRVVVSTTDVNGNVTYNNSVPSNTASAHFSGSRDPNPPGDYGMYGSASWTCSGTCLSQANPVPMAMIGGYRLTGQFWDIYALTTPARTTGMTFTTSNLSYSGTTSAVTGPSGVITLYGLTPPGFPNVGNNPADFSITGTLTSNTIQINGTLAGTVTDPNGVPAGSPAPHAAFQIQTVSGGNYVNTTVMADGSGNINWAGTLPFSTSVNFTVHCPGGSQNCSMSPSTCTINTSMRSMAWQNANGFGWNVSSGIAQVYDAQTTSIYPTATLLTFPVQGLVTRASNSQPISGIKVKDAGTNPNASTRTQNDGTYSGFFTVSGRQGGNAGSLKLNVPTQQVQGTNYLATSPATLAIPNPPDPQIPFTGINFSVQTQSGGGGSPPPGTGGTTSGGTVM